MTRQEEIEQMAVAFQDSPAEDNINTIADFFRCGAEWADKTMLDRACRWLEENIAELTGIDSYAITESFKKAMTE